MWSETAVLVLATSWAFGEYTLPEELIRCRQKDAKLNQCLQSAVPDALRKMKKGVAGLSVPPLEPLSVPTVDVEAGAGAVVISQKYRDVRLHGLTDSVITTYKADLKNHRLRTESRTPKMEFLGNYVMKGRILLLPIQGDGKANITMLDLVVKHDLVGTSVNRDGQEYMHISQYRVQFIPRKVILHFTNLFNGNKALGDQMNRFLNEHSELVFNELKESYEKSLSSVFKDVSNQIFDKVPMNQIFLEDD